MDLTTTDNGYIRHKLFGEFEESELVFLVSCVPLLMDRIVELEQELEDSMPFGQYLELLAKKQEEKS